ncbi:unnamed protein product [Aphanomyces euteiches]
MDDVRIVSLHISSRRMKRAPSPSLEGDSKRSKSDNDEEDVRELSTLSIDDDDDETRKVITPLETQNEPWPDEDDGKDMSDWEDLEHNSSFPSHSRGSQDSGI